jgi:beta-lactamase regulating signal transducer with metallopeptidase domain
LSSRTLAPALSLPLSWALYAFAAWAAIAAWFLLGVGRGLWHLHALRKSCVPVDLAALDARLRATLERNQTPRPIALCTSDQIHVPTALGLVQPAVVIPAWVMQELSADELNQILLHELAHLRRWDDWTNLAQKLVKALFFFHPAVWWIEKKISLEREMACDDAVLAETASPRAYAECLTHLAEETVVRRSLVQRSLAQRSISLAQAALGKIRQTSLRVAQILDVNRDVERNSDAGRVWKPAVSLVAVFAVACVLCLARAPRLIAFHDVDSSIAPTSTVASSAVAVAPPVVASTTPAVRSTSPGASFLARPVRATWGLPPARAATLAPHRKPAVAATSAVLPSATAQELDSMFHLTNAGAAPVFFTPVAFTETLFVVVESSSQNGSAGQPVVQIQWWRVVVLHPVADPDSNRIPPKRT